MAKRDRRYKVVRQYNVIDTLTGEAIDTYEAKDKAVEYAGHQNNLIEADPLYCTGCKRVVKTWYDHGQDCPNR